METKSQLRTKYKHLRQRCNPQLSTSIFNKLITLPSIINAQTVCTYVSFADEVDTHPFIAWLFDHHKRVIVPKITNNTITIHEITSLTDCTPTIHGILEPQNNDQVIDPHAVDVFIVPGLVFDMEGYRLGYGKGGYYDQLLAQTQSPSIGLAYTDQLTFHLPHEPHDISVSHIITDTMYISSSHKGTI